MTSSKLPAIRDAIENIWLNADGLSGVTICRIDPSPESPHEAIIVGTARARRNWAGLGVGTLKEEFTLTCDAAVVQLGVQSYTPVEQRAYEIVEAAETALREDVHLEDLLMHSRISSTEDNFEPVDKGRAASVRFVIEGETRI